MVDADLQSTADTPLQLIMINHHPAGSAFRPFKPLGRHAPSLAIYKRRLVMFLGSALSLPRSTFNTSSVSA